ncbi:MAG: hypothetical protein IMX01_08120 [Limnochordaceae bacterium]|nr:hypothetical protein [Limnochordaceae bacterium]
MMTSQAVWAAASAPVRLPFPGAIITLPEPPSLYAATDFTFRPGGPPLLFSDQPEYVEGEGILSKARFAGDWRLFLYHVNKEPSGGKYFPAVIRNLSADKPVTVSVRRAGWRGPSQNYTWVGQEALRDFFQDRPVRQLTVPAGGFVLLDPLMVSRGAYSQQLVEGLYEGTTDGPIEIFVLATDDPERFDPTLFEPITVPAGENMRGTFLNADRTLDLTSDGTETVWLLAGNQWYDPYLEGSDELDGNQRVNYGNYGVVYHVNVHLKSDVARTARIVFGAGSASFAGVIKVTAGPNAGQVVRIPETPRRVFTSYGSEVSFLAQYDLKPGEEVIYSFDFMPPGASNLPALLAVEPLETGEQ